jgi:hypothetical protein
VTLQELVSDTEVNSMRLVALFKCKPVWCKLALPDDKGGYRLNSAILSSG